MQIVLATSNRGKLRELQAVLAGAGREFIPKSHLAISDPEETAASFVENALLKARHSAKYSGQACIADDSGLVVPALGGAPGIYSSRYAGEDANDQDNNDRLLTALKDIAPDQRHAFFFCALVFLRTPEDPLPIICQARWHGIITDTPAGSHGFGYDPLFFLPSKGCTAAELSSEDKNILSHRAQALSQLSAALEQDL